MKKVAIIGTGDYSKSVVNFIERYKLYSVVGFFDNSLSIGSIINGYPIIGCDNDIISLYQKRLFDAVFIAIGYLNFTAREKLYRKVKDIVPLANLISPLASIDDTAIIGEGVMISDGAVVHANAIVEDNASVTLHSIVNHGCRVSAHSFLSTRVTMAGNVTIGKRCFIGVGVIISDGVSICDDVWLSPGSVVVKSLKKSGQYLSQATKLYHLG